VTPLWHPLSALLIPGLPAFAAPGVLGLMLRSQGRVELVYAGDRMWPTVRHGERVVVEAAEGDLRPGMVVVAECSGVLDLLRLRRIDAGGSLVLGGDADTGKPERVSRAEVRGRTRLPRRRPGAIQRAALRLGIELREAAGGLGREPRGDPAETVREKYELQAPFYATAAGEEIEEALLGRLEASVPRPGHVLVAGSGSGKECFALAAAGWRVTGVDFSARMVELAGQETRRRGLDICFRLGDLRRHSEPPASLAGVVFTYDVYSFIPEAADRIELLRRIAGWLAPGGAVFVSARRVGRPYVRAMLTLEWLLARARGRGRPWGSSHTRYLTPDGRLERSFVQVFTEHRLRREVERAGFVVLDWQGGHARLRLRADAGIRTA
jgi:SAM-dependent methyltransferase